MTLTLMLAHYSLDLQIDDKHIGRLLTLPNGIEIPLFDGMTLWVRPSGRVGVPMVMPDKIIEHPAKREKRAVRAFEGSGALI